MLILILTLTLIANSVWTIALFFAVASILQPAYYDRSLLILGFILASVFYGGLLGGLIHLVF